MNGDPPLIAVVDDEETVRQALRRLLRSLGFDVEVFESGIEFLAWLADRRPDCLVLDLHMPHVDGFEVLAELTKVLPRVPVVVITGRDTPEAQQRSMTLNAAAYLRKPVEAETLVEAINASMEVR